MACLYENCEGVQYVCVSKYRHIPASQETFCNVYGPQFDTTELDVVSAFENIFDICRWNQQVCSAGNINCVGSLC
jgi:hypothetical protein